MINLMQAIFTGDLKFPAKDKRKKVNAKFRVIIGDCKDIIEDCDGMIDDLYRQSRYIRALSKRSPEKEC